MSWEPVKNKGFLKQVFGNLYADKGYIGKQFAKVLFVDDIHLATNNKNTKLYRRKRSIIEIINNELKNI